MAPDWYDFNHSGPKHLTGRSAIDWKNEDHKRSVVASLVNGVYVVERYRQKQPEGSQALASPWWKSFNFQMREQLKEDDVSSIFGTICGTIFGAIYKFEPPGSHSNLSTDGCPCYVIAFRGTLFKEKTFIKDLYLDHKIIRNKLRSSSRFKIAYEAVRSLVASVGSSNVWLAGHSLGSAIALLAGKTMAKEGIFLESFLFNPPFPSLLIEGIKLEKVKLGIRIVSSTSTALLAYARGKRSGDSFLALAKWTPCLFVNPADHICSGYVGYFKHKKKMVKFRLGGIERLRTQHSLRGLIFRSAKSGKESEDSQPMHRIPSANLMVNSTPSPHFIDFIDAHRIGQWWRQDLHLEPTLNKYN